MCTSYDHGIQTFDTADASTAPFSVIISTLNTFSLQIYSNGLSEIMLGKAIRELELPREELVIMTKVRLLLVFSSLGDPSGFLITEKIFAPIAPRHDVNIHFQGLSAEKDFGIINQQGLSRKVCSSYYIDCTRAST